MRKSECRSQNAEIQKSAAPWKSGALAPRKTPSDWALAPVDVVDVTIQSATTRAEAHLPLLRNAPWKGRSSTVLLTVIPNVDA